MRLQLALNVSDIDRAVAYYSDLFGVAPHKRRPGYDDYVRQRDFRLVHFGGLSLVSLDVPTGMDLHLVGRLVRERYGAALSLVRQEGASVLVLGADDLTGRRTVDVASMVEHLALKFRWADALSDADHVARLRIQDLDGHPERLDDVVAEIGMGRSILEG